MGVGLGSTSPRIAPTAACREDASLEKLVANGELKTIAVIPEPRDPRAFAIRRR